MEAEGARSSGCLWVVATPLGNPADLSPRAREVLAAVDCVLAEDTRRTGLLLSTCGVKARGFMSLHDHNEEAKLPQLAEELAAGRNFALVSDAGTPLFSDPGFRLVQTCRRLGIRVTPVPGPSAPLAALCASGLPPQPFVFLGFPPRKAGEIRKFFAPWAVLPATLCFFERKDRLKGTLELVFELGGERELCVARELTKTFEEFINLPLGEYASLPDELLGEITVLLGPPQAASAGRRLPEEELALLLEEAAEETGGLKPRQLAREMQRQAPGWSVGELYDFIVRQGKSDA